MASAIVFRSPFVPIAPRGLARPGQPRRSPHHLISGVVYRGKRCEAGPWIPEQEHVWFWHSDMHGRYML